MKSGNKVHCLIRNNIVVSPAEAVIRTVKDDLPCLQKTVAAKEVHFEDSTQVCRCNKTITYNPPCKSILATLCVAQSTSSEAFPEPIPGGQESSVAIQWGYLYAFKDGEPGELHTC